MAPPVSPVPRVPNPILASPHEPPSLPRSDVHLWHADLDEAADPTVGLALLSEDERERAARMARAPRRRFVRSRCLLRTILGGYLDRNPALLVFELTGEGKPELAAPWGVAPESAASTGRPSGALRFNLSHAEGRWLLAVSRRVVGVDLERSDRRVDIERVARRIFLPEEVGIILALEGAPRLRAFFRAWTAREALVKARGEGMFTLSLPVAIDVHPGRPLALTGDAAEPWKLVEVPLKGDWCGALAVHGDFERVSAFVVASMLP